MTLADERILEYLAENEAGTPSEILREGGLTYSSQWIAKRCRVLADKGFVQRISAAPTYRITERGESYLEGEFDARGLDDQDASGNPSAAAD